MRILNIFSRHQSQDCSPLLLALLEQAAYMGLQSNDLENACEMFERGENTLCFDIIANQLDSYDIEITQEFYNLLSQTGQCLNMPAETYSFNQKLIRSDTHIPKPVSDGLSRIMASLYLRK